MAGLRIVGFSGNFARPSRTRTLVDAILRHVAARGIASVEAYDLVDAGPLLGAATERRALAAAPDKVVSAIEQADGLVVATPVYKGAYTGLFKHAFDLIDPKMLEGRPVIIAATGASPGHASVIDYHLRPLFAFFHAQTFAPGLYATNTDFVSAEELVPAVEMRIAREVDNFERWFGRRQA